MNLIEQWIALFFDRLPYSEEAAEARGKIERALKNKAPDAAPDNSPKSMAVMKNWRLSADIRRRTPQAGSAQKLCETGQL